MAMGPRNQMLPFRPSCAAPSVRHPSAPLQSLRVADINWMGLMLHCRCPCAASSVVVVRLAKSSPPILKCAAALCPGAPFFRPSGMLHLECFLPIAAAPCGRSP